VVNTTVVLLELTAPIRSYHDQQLVSQAMRTAPAAFSYCRELFLYPWRPVLVVILLVGIVAEARRYAFSPILNLVPFTLWLILALRDPFYNKQGLIILPLVIIIVIDAALYIAALRPGQQDSTGA
jgi:hypothetical protein